MTLRDLQRSLQRLKTFPVAEETFEGKDVHYNNGDSEHPCLTFE